MENEYENDPWIKMVTMRPGGSALSERLLGLCDMPLGKRILDVACGVGDTVSMLTAKGYMVTGVDVSEKLISIGRRLFPNAELIVADAARLPFEPALFDALLVQCSREIIGELPLYALKNEGVVYISDVYDKCAPPEVPEGCELIAWEDVSGELTGFAATLAWNGIKPPDCFIISQGSIGYYIMTARKSGHCRT